MTTSGSTPITGPDPDPPLLRVAVGVLRRGDGRLLVADRDAARHAGGGLEFPGGKVEPGEPLESALARELEEELGVRIMGPRPLIRLRHRYSDRLVELAVAMIDDWRGEARGCEGQRLRWYLPGELEPERFPAANRPIIAALQWPSVLRVTPPVTDAAGVDRLIARVRARAGERAFIQLRAPALPAPLWQRLVDGVDGALRDQTERAGGAATLLLNTVPEDPRLGGACTGLHLSADRAAETSARPAAARWLSCSAHDEAELRVAEALGADFAVVGPVRPTASHPRALGIGWEGLARLTASTALPIYAIGGLSPVDLAPARDHGAVGVAGISGFWH